MNVSEAIKYIKTELRFAVPQWHMREPIEVVVAEIEKLLAGRQKCMWTIIDDGRWGKHLKPSCDDAKSTFPYLDKGGHDHWNCCPYCGGVIEVKK